MSNKEMVSTETAENKGQRKVFVPNKLLDCLPRSACLPNERLRWNTNEEIASYLISFDRHDEWLCCSLKTRPKNGSIILYNRKKVKYRKDGYCWKKRKDGKTTREDHMKLKVQGMECLYGCYVHSSIVPTFHRRCYWLLQNPDIVLVHYLNVPSPEDSGRCSPLLCTVSERHDTLRWSRDDLLGQLKPMFHSIKCSMGSGDFSIEELVQHILDRQRTKPQPRTHACLCSTNQVSPGVNIPHRCNSTKHRIISPKLPPSSSGPAASPPSSEPGESGRGGGESKLPQLQPQSPASSPSPSSTSAPPPSLALSLSPTSSVAPPLLPLCLELGALGESDGVKEESRSEEEELDERTDDDDEGSAPPTKLVLLQTSHAPSSPSPRQHTDSGSAPLLLASQDRPGEPSQPTNQTPAPPGGQQPLVLPSSNQLPGPEAPPPAESSHQHLELLSSSAAVAMETASLATVQVKEERRRRYDSEDACMDSQEEAEPEELDISFDSQFPDLISDLITDEPGPAAAPPAPPSASGPAVFPTGVRYVVPPQPSPSSSFLPFPQPLPAAARLAAITDFSPEWSYPEGGVKVLITGPWSEPSGRYSCVFDQSAVPASLIQPGVLRCYCPAHEAGLVCLQVLESGGSVSSSVLFEYRARNASSLPSSQLDWLSLDDNQFRMSILERLEQMERRMAEMAARDGLHHHHHQQQQQSGNQLATPPPLPDDQQQCSQWFERRIVGVCERMMRGACWGGRGGGRGESLRHSAGHRGMTLLHLAAAQGYTHLIHTLIHWRAMSSDSLDLEQEVDPLNIDHFSCTPLMWACALGHQRAAELLYSWNGLALGIPDSLGRLPLAVARSRGHTRLAAALEELHTQRSQAATRDGPPPSPLSTSLDTGLSSSSSLPSPSDPSSPSPSSAYSSGPAPMDTSPSSPSSLSSSSLSISPSSPSFIQSTVPLASMWREEPNPTVSTGNPGLTASGSRDLMDYKNAPPTDTPPQSAGRRALLEEQLLSYGENAENEGEEEEYLEDEVLQVDMATLAEQIIEATPERIKQEDFPRGAESPLRERRDNPAIQDTWLATYLETVDSQSPPRRVCPPSPLSALALQRLRPPSSAAWAEFLNASANGKMERDFALLTLTDGEQRELYEAARIIQNAFRRYKGRRLKEQQDMAAAVIQRCYRKYKQLTWIALKYALYKKMTQAAILIQSKFRSYYEQKRFQQSRRAAVLIQQYYRSYKEYERLKQAPRGGAALNPKSNRGSFLTKKQDQAARKIMRFLRRCRHRIKELKQSRELERRGLTT
ncbi:calmodulin-binding transcription activator 1 [Poecilia latipinna]|uniref:calmodulin-binding transcription activator 1 n=1 Tax=Poecilia latipinna TaxID=48699 RepID=UPI00072DA54C|nr:PREDICTED: calmodulin-binding transcription activator 2 [Poecilia latipinna]